MLYTGYSKVEHEFDVDIKINEEIEIATNIINRLKSELEEKDFNIVVRNLSIEYLNAIKL